MTEDLSIVTAINILANDIITCIPLLYKYTLILLVFLYIKICVNMSNCDNISEEIIVFVTADPL